MLEIKVNEKLATNPKLVYCINRITSHPLIGKKFSRSLKLKGIYAEHIA